jgi:hypothetical protein
VLGKCQPLRCLWKTCMVDFGNQKCHFVALLNSSWCLLHVEVASVENRAPVWLRRPFHFFLLFSFSPPRFLHPTLQFLNRPLSFLLFSISSLMFWLISVLFQITYENKNLFQFYPHLIFFTSLSFLFSPWSFGWYFFYLK